MNNPTRNRRSLAWCALAICLGWYSCATGPIASNGGGSDTEVSGRIVDSSGYGIENVRVMLLSEQYNPAFDGRLADSCIDTTDSNGGYRFVKVRHGVHRLFSAELATARRSLKSITVGMERALVIDDDSLKNPARLAIWLNEPFAIPGFVYITGTPFCKALRARDSTISFDTIPVGSYPPIRFQASPTDTPAVLFEGITLTAPGDRTLHLYDCWGHRAEIRFDAAASGLAPGDTVLDFPVLVRLSRPQFDFSQARAKGEDLRIARSDGQPVPFEIARWDSGAGWAEVWMRMDSLFGKGNEPLMALWGNNNAKTYSRPGAVFDTGDGYAGVWHLEESGGTQAKDATWRLRSLSSFGMSGASDQMGILGRGQVFDGVDDHFAADSLLAAESVFTVCVWIYPQADSGDRCILSCGETGFDLSTIVGNRLRFVDARGSAGADTLETVLAAANQWTLVTAVRAGPGRYLYVNGLCVDSSMATGNQSAAPANSWRLYLGAQPGGSGRFFEGMIDEIRISRRAWTPRRITLTYQNQRADQTFTSVVVTQ